MKWHMCYGGYDYSHAEYIRLDLSETRYLPHRRSLHVQEESSHDEKHSNEK